MSAYSSLLENIILPFGDYLRGIPIQKKYSLLKESQYLKSETIKKNQTGQLQKLINHVYDNVPYYSSLMRELNITPTDLNRLEKLPLLPKLTKELALTENQTLQVKNMSTGHVAIGRTGGSTGEPLTYYHDKETQAFNRACHYRGLSWADFNWGEPMVCLFGGTLGFGNTNLKELIRGRLTNQYYFPAFEIKGENLDELLRFFKKVNPKAIIGYTSSIYQLSLLLKESGKKISVPIAFTTGEILPTEYRELICNQLNCNIFDYYGFGEIQGIAYQCPAGNYHISDEKVILEIEPIEEYQNPLIGRALFTDTTNFSFPFIRYEPGDVVELLGENCSCGRELTAIKKIIGRKNDFIKSSNGNALAGIFFPHLFRMATSIRYYQIVQEQIDQITIKYVPQLNQSKLDEEKQKLTQKIREYTSPLMEVIFEEVTDIPKTPSGKLRVVVSTLKNYTNN